MFRGISFSGSMGERLKEGGFGVKYMHSKNIMMEELVHPAFLRYRLIEFSVYMVLVITQCNYVDYYFSL